MTELTSDNVKNLFTKVVCGPEDPDFKCFDMIAHKMGVNMKKVEEHRQEIADMLSQLPKEFMSSSKGGGGGWSFLNACEREDKVQWTGMHIQVEALITMGMALNMVAFLLPHEMWSVLPGGVPYFIVDIDGVDKDDYMSNEKEDEEVKDDT